jgi:uncharacterized membrane protein (DUF4010 family)
MKVEEPASSLFVGRLDSLELPTIFEKVGVALALGLLVGLQREHVQSQLAGIRTFALITVLGAVCALVAREFDQGGWVVAVGGFSVAALLVVGNIVLPRSRDIDPGLTTEVAALVMYGVGAYLVVGHTAVAVAVAGGTAVLLHFKTPLHRFVARIGEKDIKAIMQFVLIALVILPVLPDRAFDPFGVLNPHHIWLMVSLIVGLSLAGYIAYKIFGERAAILAGALGGLVSSTAATVGFSRQARQAEGMSGIAALMILLATAVSFVRVTVEIAVVAPGSFALLAPPLGLMIGFSILLAVGTYCLTRGQSAELPPQSNPAELKSAFIFGALYAAVLFGVAAAREHVGNYGLFAIAILSGTHDMDAITLSTSRMVDQGTLDAVTGWQLIIAASLSNLVVKALIVALMGPRRLLVWVAALFGAIFIWGILVQLIWPAVGALIGPPGM